MSVRTEKQGPVTTVIIDHPERRNAVDRPTATALAEAFAHSKPIPTRPWPCCGALAGIFAPAPISAP